MEMDTYMRLAAHTRGSKGFARATGQNPAAVCGPTPLYGLEMGNYMGKHAHTTAVKAQPLRKAGAQNDTQHISERTARKALARQQHETSLAKPKYRGNLRCCSSSPNPF